MSAELFLSPQCIWNVMPGKTWENSEIFLNCSDPSIPIDNHSNKI